MTDNSDFMARYLPPEAHPDRPADAGRPEHGPHDAEQGQHMAPAPAPPWRPPPAPVTPGPGLHAVPPPPAPLRAPDPVGGPGPGGAPPPAFGLHANDAPPGSPVPGRHPGQVPEQPMDGREAGGLSAAQRWAPQADPQATSHAQAQILVDEVRKPRRVPPEMGWRKIVYVSTGGLVNLGAGPAERLLRDQRARITANIPGNYQISAISIKGGVGKTTLVAGVGTALCLFRTEPVIAIDANPTYGALGRLIDPQATPSLREFLAAPDLTDYPKARSYTGKNTQGLEVLGGNQNVANPLELTPKVFRDTISRARRFYQLSLVDCGAEIDHQVIPEVLSASDALMIVGSMNLEGGLAVEKTLDWLASRNGHELLKRSVVVLNDAYRCASKKHITHFTHTLRPRVRSVKVVPWDAHLGDAAPLDFNALRRPTRLALVDLAAELAHGFPTAGALTG